MGATPARRPPSRDECRSLLVALGTPQGLLGHVSAVAAAAVALADLCGADRAFCEAAALLHDIGKAPGAIDSAAVNELLRRDAGHDVRGAALLRSLGPPFDSLADAVDRHAVHAVLQPVGGRRPTTLEEKIVFLADKMVGGGWLGLAGRLADLEQRYGHRFAIRLCVPGCQLIRLELAGRAALGADDLEYLVAAAVRSASAEGEPASIR